MQSLAATHAVLVVQRGKFVSLTDPPEIFREATAACRNIGVWPVLVGRPGEQDTMLASPIILYDYPQIAPESPGDLFDGTEIDEILTFRIMTLTEEEKAMAAATDDRTRRLTGGPKPWPASNSPDCTARSARRRGPKPRPKVSITWFAPARSCGDLIPSPTCQRRKHYGR